MNSYDIPRHKVFISYHHELDQKYKNTLMNDFVEQNPNNPYYIRSIFEDCSVHEDEIDDEGKTNEQIRKIIRDEYIKEASVLILLCGQETKNRKFIDWEIHAAMFDTETNPKLGILVINLPYTNKWIYASEDDDKPLITTNNGSGDWHHFTSRKEFEECYPYLPSRIIDNLESRIDDNNIIPITIVDWDVIRNDMYKFKMLIDNAYKRSKSKTKHYNCSAPLRRNNL